MMIHPSYNELIEAINENTEDNDNAMLINSRYSLVLATSKRARQLISGKEPLIQGDAKRKPLSIAIEELYEGKVQILEDNSEVDDDSHYISEALPADMFNEETKDSDSDEEYDEESDDEYDDDNDDDYDDDSDDDSDEDSDDNMDNDEEDDE